MENLTDRYMREMNEGKESIPLKALNSELESILERLKSNSIPEN